MKPSQSIRRRGFTLMETVIAIGVLAVLLTGFVVVFTPAAAGIRKSINVQESDRLSSALEQELVTMRQGGTTYKSGFDKAYKMIIDSNNATKAILVYQYRGELGGTPRTDGTAKPVSNIQNKSPGKDYIVIPMARTCDDALFKNEDLAAVEGGVYLVKCTQLGFGKLPPPAAATDLGLVPGAAGKIQDPKNSTAWPNGTAITDSDLYPEAVVAFAADFHMLPAKSPSFFTGGAFTAAYAKAKTPIFSRNLAVRR